MILLDESPFGDTDNLALAKSEINEFLACDGYHFCKFKEYEGVALTTSVSRYRQAVSHMGLTGKVKIKQSKGKIIGVK